MAIVDLGTFQSYMRGTGQPTAAVAEEQRALDAAEQAVRAYCRRSFETPGETATPRVFRPLSGSLLYVDDFTELSAVSNDGTAVSDSARQLEPLNGLDGAGNPVPYNKLVALSGAWVVDGERATVSVTAKWGWTTVPTAVVEAVVELAKEVLYVRDMRGGVVGVGDFAFRVRVNHDVSGLLAPFVRWDRAGIA